MHPIQRIYALDWVILDTGKSIESRQEWEKAQRELMESWIKQGYTDKHDPALKYTVLHRHPDAFEGKYPINNVEFIKITSKFSLEVSEYEVTEPFRNRLYHDFISFTFRALLDQYQAVCEQEEANTDYSRSGLKNAIRAEMTAIKAMPAPQLPPQSTQYVAPKGSVFAAFLSSLKGGRRTRRCNRSARKTLRKHR